MSLPRESYCSGRDRWSKMSLEECFEKRQLRRGRPDAQKSAKALKAAARDLSKAVKRMEHAFYEDVILYSYTAMFQAARALLFRDGIFEKSHYCVVEYLRRNYLGDGKLDQSHIHWLNTYRIERHDTLYGLDELEVGEADARDSIERAKAFLEVVGRILKESLRSPD